MTGIAAGAVVVRRAGRDDMGWWLKTSLRVVEMGIYCGQPNNAIQTRSVGRKKSETSVLA